MPKYQLVTFLFTCSSFPSLHCTSYFPMFSPSFCSSRAREREEHPLQGNIQTAILCVQLTNQLVAQNIWGHIQSMHTQPQSIVQSFSTGPRTLAGEYEYINFCHPPFGQIWLLRAYSLTQVSPKSLEAKWRNSAIKHTSHKADSGNFHSDFQKGKIKSCTF